MRCPASHRRTRVGCRDCELRNLAQRNEVGGERQRILPDEVVLDVDAIESDICGGRPQSVDGDCGTRDIDSSLGLNEWQHVPIERRQPGDLSLSLIHISEPTRLLSISYAVFCLKK